MQTGAAWYMFVESFPAQRPGYGHARVAEELKRVASPALAGPSRTQIPKRIHKVDPPLASITDTISVVFARIPSSSCLIPLVLGLLKKRRPTSVPK